MRKQLKNEPIYIGCYKKQCRRAGRSLILFVTLFSAVVTGRAQQNLNGATGKFTSTEYYPAPYQTQMKTRLSGADAQPVEGGLLAIQQLKLETFITNGQPQVIVETPECIYDSINGEANAAGKLSLQNGDGKVRVEGDGFLWRQNDSFLTISNNVKTIIASITLAAGLSAGAQDATNLTTISSRTADFDLNDRHAVYSGDVHVTDPRMKLTCEWLVADLPQSGHIHQIVAETNVVIDLVQSNLTVHATGDKAVYDYSVENGVTNESVTLTGNPHAEGVRGGLAFNNWAEKIIWYPANNGLQMINQRGTLQKTPEETNSPANPNPLLK